jgi:hypothetical protein
MPSQHPYLHPSQPQHSKATVRRTGLIPHRHLYHHNPHDRKNNHSCSEYSIPNSDSVATQTPHTHHRARGTRFGVNPRSPAPCVCTRLGRGFFFSLEKVRRRYACISSCASWGFYIISVTIFSLRVLFWRTWTLAWTLGTAALLQSLRTRAHFHLRSSSHFCRFSFSLSKEHFLLHLISPQTSAINQSLSHPTFHLILFVLLLTL